MSTEPAAPPLPVNFAVLLYPAFQALDVFGPLDVLNTLSLDYPSLTLSILSRDLTPVSTLPSGFGSTFSESVVPTHTLSSPPLIDVLLVPGGLGTRAICAPDSPEAEFIRRVYPSLRYLITVCTGSALAAKAGVLDGKRATGNKRNFEWTAEQGPKTYWVAKARWVRDGNVWTTSGISAGVDGCFNFVEEVFGKDKAEDLAQRLEYRRRTHPDDDEFAETYGLKDRPPVDCGN